MIVRKSNLDDQSQFGGTPAFNALAWFDRPAKRRFAFVSLRAEETDVRALISNEIIIDGSCYFCLDVRTFSPPPYSVGDSIGLLVVDA